MIKLVPIDENNYSECLKLSVFESQRGFVATNVKSLAQAYIHRDRTEPYCIYHDDTMVGFVQIISDDENKENMNLWRYMIDQRYQGMGYGKEALKVLIDNIRSRNRFKTITLSYEPENTLAEKLYTSFGFVPTGVIDEGEVEMILNL